MADAAEMTERVVDASVRTAKVVDEKGRDTGARCALVSMHTRGGRGIQAAFEAWWKERDKEERK